MKYQILVPEMHCNGCANLVLTCLEDASLSEVSVNLTTNFVTFKSEFEKEDVVRILDEAFVELSRAGYSYKDLVQF